LLKVYYAPATSATFFLFSFLLQPLKGLMRQTRQALGAINQSIFLRCLWYVQVSQIFEFIESIIPTML